MWTAIIGGVASLGGSVFDYFGQKEQAKAAKAAAAAAAFKTSSGGVPAGVWVAVGGGVLLLTAVMALKK